MSVISRSLLTTAFGIVLIGLQACVTTESKVFTADTSPERAIEARVNLAMKYYQKNDLESARRNLDEALSIDDKSPTVHNALALVFSREGDVKLAEKHFKRAIAGDSSYSTARNNYAAFLYNQERYKEAMKQLEYVADDELYKERLLALGNLGRTAKKLGDLERAEAAFKRMLNIDSRNVLALLELAQLAYDNKEYELSSSLHDKYRRIAPQQSAQGLFLGLRLSEAITDTGARASYVMALRNLYPESDEYKRFLSGNYE